MNTVTTAGALYFSAAGNFGNLTHGDSRVWEGDFVDGGVTAPPLERGTLHSFGATRYDVLTARGSAVVLQWSDALGASDNDYDLFMLNATGTNIVAASTITQSGAQDPSEIISCNAITCPVGGRVVVVLFSGARRALRVDPKRGGLSINTTGATFGHNAAASAFAVAATDVANAGTGQFTGGPADPVEPYSSDGPRKIFYHPDGTAITPGNLLFGTNGGTTLAKVDLTAADGVSSFVAGAGPFFGTSASAPHAAAIAGLIKSANLAATNAQIRNALLNSALDIEAVGIDRDSGVGIVMAPAGIRALLSTLVVGKTFVPNSILVGATSELTITVQNTNAIAIRSVAFTDTYPASVVNAGTPGASVVGAGCSGSLAATAGGNTLALTSGVVPAGTTCSFKVRVTSNTASTYIDGSGALTTPIALNSAAASSSLAVRLAPAITMAKSFDPATIAIGAPAVLTITLFNPNPLPMTGAAFTDSYPPGMFNTGNAAPAAAAAEQLTGANFGDSVALTGGTIPANGSCTSQSTLRALPRAAISIPRGGDVDQQRDRGTRHGDAGGIGQCRASADHFGMGADRACRIVGGCRRRPGAGYFAPAPLASERTDITEYYIPGRSNSQTPPGITVRCLIVINQSLSRRCTSTLPVCAKSATPIVPPLAGGDAATQGCGRIADLLSFHKTELR